MARRQQQRQQKQRRQQHDDYDSEDDGDFIVDDLGTERRQGRRQQQERCKRKIIRCLYNTGYFVLKMGATKKKVEGSTATGIRHEGCGTVSVLYRYGIGTQHLVVHRTS